ncbi:MAG: hypothetical protein ABIN48_07985 [Ginsengibacter sp.]
MYKKSLIGNVVSDESLDIPKDSKIQHLGLNQKKILFLVNNTQNKYLPDAEMDMLTNLLSACNFTVADIALVNYAQNPDITYEKLIDQFKSEKLLTFGLSTKDLNLPFNVPDFQIQKFQNQTYLLNPPMDKILIDVDLKKKLWICIKNLFSI